MQLRHPDRWAKPGPVTTIPMPKLQSLRDADRVLRTNKRKGSPTRMDPEWDGKQGADPVTPFKMQQ